MLHLTGKIDSEEAITVEKSEANVENLKVTILPAPQADGSASSKVQMMTTVPNSKEQLTGIVSNTQL